MPADDLVGAWRTNLYTHTLERTVEGWKCSGMTFVVTHARGNEMARQFVPDE